MATINGMANFNTTPTTSTQKSNPTTSGSYSSQVLAGSNDEQKWTKGTNPQLRPGQMLYKNGYYYWVGSGNNVQKTKDFNTAYSTAGFKASDTPGQVVVADVQNFNLSGGQIQYDPKTKSYYFKDPKSGKMLTTPDINAAYNILNPKATTTTETDPYGMRSRTETYASGTRPDPKGEQFFQPVYQGQSKDFAQPGYSLMGNQSGLGAMDAMKAQNTQGTASTYGVAMGPVSQYTQFANQAPMPVGIGQTRNPFSTAQQPTFTPRNYGSFGNMAQRFQQPQQFRPQQSFFGQGMQGGMGRMATPFGSAGSQGAFGGGFGGAGLYGKK